MKTKNNVQKAILKSLAVVFSLVLLSFTVNAQNFWKNLIENSSFNEIAMKMTETDFISTKLEASSSNDADLFAALLEEEIENPLELENWMTEATYFKTKMFSIEEETEEVLELEDWMINFEMNKSQLFNSNFSCKSEKENELKLEHWMTEKNYWN